MNLPKLLFIESESKAINLNYLVGIKRVLTQNGEVYAVFTMATPLIRDKQGRGKYDVWIPVSYDDYEVLLYAITIFLANEKMTILTIYKDGSTSLERGKEKEFKPQSKSTQDSPAGDKKEPENEVPF